MARRRQAASAPGCAAKHRRRDLIAPGPLAGGVPLAWMRETVVRTFVTGRGPPAHAAELRRLARYGCCGAESQPEDLARHLAAPASRLHSV